MSFIRLDVEPLGFTRRRKALLINAEALIILLRSLDGRHRHRVEGIPADARVIGVEVTPWLQGEPMIKVFLESGEFDELPEGAEAPAYAITAAIFDEVPA